MRAITQSTIDDLTFTIAFVQTDDRIGTCISHFADLLEETDPHTADITHLFMKCRTALESLEECPNTGAALLKAEADKRRTMSNEEFDSWFEEETGHQNPFQFDLDPKVMREVANMHSEMEGSHGLDRDGGMWHLASMISNAVKSGKENGEIGRAHV